MITLLFGLLNVPAVQESAKDFVVEELKKQLDTELGIGRLHFQPFNTVELDSVYLYDQSNEKVLVADKITASIDLFSLLKKKIVITSTWLNDFEIYISKQNAEAPLNIQYIIDAFKPKDDKPKSQLDIKLNSINIVNGQFFYDIKDKPQMANSLDANHIHVSDLHAKIAVKSVLGDSLNIQVKKIELKEKSGLEIKDLVFRLVTQDKKVSVRGFKLDLPSSRIELDRCELDLTPTNDSAKILDYAVLDCQIAPSYIAPKDIAALLPSLQSFKDFVTIQAGISGSMSNLKITDLSLGYGEKMQLVSNIEIKDAGRTDKMYVLGSIDKFTIGSNEIESLIHNFDKNKKPLPPLLTQLVNVSFEGDISGYLSQLTAFGTLETDLGIVNMDVLFGLNPKHGISSFMQGKVYTSNFELGKLLNSKDLNQVSLNMTVNLEKPVHGNIKGNAKGNIYDFDFKGYTYNEIDIDVNYDGLRIDGNVAVNDKNGSINIDGLFDLSDKEHPELNFKAQVKNIQLSELQIAKNMEYSYLSFVIDADFVGKNIDNAEGYIKIDSIDFIRQDKVFQMDSFLVQVSGLADERNFKITSGLLNGEIKGVYSFSSMISSIQQTLHPYLPAFIKQGSRKKPDDKANILRFDFQVHNSESLSSIFNLPVTIYSTAKIVGVYNNVNDKFNVELFTPSIKAGGMNIKSGYIVVKNPENVINAEINALIIGKKEAINDISIKSDIGNNLISTNISLLNNGMQKAKGNFSINTLFAKNDSEPLQIDIDILPSELLLNNANWKMDKSHITIQEGAYAIDNFLVYRDDGSQEVKINGKYSNNNPKNILKAELKEIDLEYIFQTLAIDALRFGGAATGSMFVSSVENKPYANTRLQVTDFKFNGTNLGNLNIFSELDEETNKVILDGLIVSKENKQTKVDGSIDPVDQALSIHFDADSLDISFLNKYAESLFEDIRGRGTGKVHLYGDFSNVTVEGTAFVKDAGLGIKFLNTYYTFTDTVYLKKDLIYFNNIDLIDQNNNIAKVSGKVAHDLFRDFMFYVDLSANNFLVYNATEKQNPIFYGQVYGTGKGSIGGDESTIDIDISMRTENKTVVRLNFMEDVVNEYSFITYKSKQETDSNLVSIAPSLTPLKTESGMDINMNFYIDATPDAVIELLMDPVGGDIIKGSGSGALRFEWGTKASPRLYGTYNINRGNYNFTFQRLMERRFTIQDGSSVQFRGDPFEATLDVNAIYKLNASLSDLDKDLAEKSGQTTVPVNCILNLAGPLKHPTVKLDISLPATNAEVERQVKSLLNTEDMINRQVAYLLILSKFKAPDGANVDHPTSDFAAVASATLSNQLSKIVNQVDDRWQLGTNIRYSDAELTYTEVELLLSSQLMNNRLLINGNFGYRNDQILGKDFIGDVDIEYLLNNAGSWRVKVYNHYNEKYYYIDLGRSLQTQGVGLVYKKDFDVLSDLIRKPRIRIRRDTITPLAPDSVKKGSPLSSFIKFKK